MTTPVNARTFGGRLRHYRKERFGPARRLAAKTGITQGILSKYERNEVEPSYERLLVLCKALCITPNDLLLP